MWREIDPRAPERERPEPGLGRVSGQTEMESKAVSDDPRDAFTRDLDLPRGSSRERVRANDKEYRLSGDDVRVLATVGAFRVVPASDLREPNPRTPTRPARDLERLRDLGLVHTTPYVVGRTRTTLVTLTGDGRDVLEGGRRPDAADRQAFYVGITKPRELAHDSKVYSAYMKAAERLAERGEPVRRVVLEEELKREYQRFLQAENRARRDHGETPEERAETVARWAQEHDLPYEDGHVQFPDARIEYRGPRWPTRRGEHRGRYTALPRRTRGGQGSIRIHALSSLWSAPWRSPDNREKRPRRRPAPCRGAATGVSPVQRYSQREHLPLATSAFQGELIVASFKSTHINHGFERCDVVADLSGASCCSPGTQVGIENSNVVLSRRRPNGQQYGRVHSSA